MSDGRRVLGLYFRRHSISFSSLAAAFSGFQPTTERNLQYVPVSYFSPPTSDGMGGGTSLRTSATASFLSLVLTRVRAGRILRLTLRRPLAAISTMSGRIHAEGKKDGTRMPASESAEAEEALRVLAGEQSSGNLGTIEIQTI